MAIRRGTDSHNSIIDAVHDMETLIERTKLVAEIENNDIQLFPKRVSVDELMINCLKKFNQLDRIRVHLNDAHYIWADEFMLKIILCNLIDNSSKYSGLDSYVDIHILQSNGAVTIHIDNDGGSVGRPDHVKIFSKYYRNPLVKTSGSGLGLYIIKGLADKLSGSLRYISNQERIRFALCLPR